MNKSKGFTIAEVIVVVFVISILFTVVISNFSAARLQLSLSRVGFQFEQDVSRAQNMAVASVPYKDAFGVEHQVDGYGIYIDASGSTSAPNRKSYILYADKSPGNNQYDASDYIVNQVNFSLTEPGIILQIINGISTLSTSINFKSANLSTSISNLAVGQNSISVIFAQLTDSSKTKTVLINTSGLVKVQ